MISYELNLNIQGLPAVAPARTVHVEYCVTQYSACGILCNTVQCMWNIL